MAGERDIREVETPASAATATGSASDETAPSADRGRAVQDAAAIRVRGVSKVFPNGTEALTPVDLDVGPGEFVSVVGPSGCGKSTLLRIIAGLSDPTAGACEIPAAAQRAFVFQDPTLLPWRSVKRNSELLLELEGVARAEREQRAGEALRLVNLDGFEKSYPRNLSGGMRMRLSLARSLALRPSLFLMDEPFSALDEITREALNDELLRIWAGEDLTAVFVTHNVFEATYLSSRVIVMSARPGRIVADLPIPFEYPRTPELRATPEFAALSGRISAELRRWAG